MKSLKVFILTCLLTLAACTETKPLFVEAVDLDVFPRIEECKERDKGEFYVHCVESDKVFAKAKQYALEKNLPIFIIWGFDSCPACAAFEARNFANAEGPSARSLKWKLNKAQRKAFEEYTNGQNQIILLRLRSRGNAVKLVAEPLGANDIARAQSPRQEKVWSPMPMMYNPINEALSSESYFGAYGYCTFQEQIKAGLIKTGVIPEAPKFEVFCEVLALEDKEQVEAAKKKCEANDFRACMEVGEYYFEEKKREQSQTYFAKACRGAIQNGCDAIPK